MRGRRYIMYTKKTFWQDVVVQAVFFACLLVVVEAKEAHSKMRVKEDAHLLRLVGMPTGQVSRKAITKVLLPYLEKKFVKGIHPNNRVKAVSVVAYVDRVPYGKLYSDKDNAMNGGLAVARAMAVFSVLRNFASLHDLRISTAFVRCKRKDPKCRGIEISFHREPFCSQEELNSSKETLREFDREPTVAYVAKGSSDPQKVVLLCKRKGKGGEQTFTKTCLASLRKPCKEGTIWNRNSKSCESVCKEDEVWDSNKKSCEPRCKGNFVWDQNSKRCECPACPKGQYRDKRTCGVCEDIVAPSEVKKGGDKAEVIDFKDYFTLSGGVSNASLCPEGTGRNVQVQVRASWHLHKNFAIIGGIESAGILFRDGNDIKAGRGIFLALGIETSVSTKIAKKKLDFGARAKVLASPEAQYPALEGFVRIHLNKKYFLEGSVNSIFYTPVDPNTGRTGDPANSINFGVSVGFRF